MLKKMLVIWPWRPRSQLQRQTESDNNIKLGFWTDIFARQLNSSAEVDPSTGGTKIGFR